MLRVEGLVKTYAGAHARAPVRAVDEVTFHVKEGEFFTLLGPSGCGKSTTLHCLAGLDTPDAGSIQIAGETVYCRDRRIALPANRRNIGMIFQSYAIWPHMTVFENVAFPLKERRRNIPSSEVKSRVMTALEMVKLGEFAHRPSPHLSGGQQQRVALARAVVHQPRLLLLDEPLSNLDAKLRDAMRLELHLLVKTLGITTIFVTHDQVEAMAMSDQVALMRAGKIVQQAPPRDIFLRPTNAFTADFMGRSNLIPATVGAPTADGETMVSTPFGDLTCSVAPEYAKGARILVVIRPQAILASPHNEVRPRSPNVLAATVVRTHFLGEAIEVEAEVAGHSIRVVLPPFSHVEAQQRLWLEVPPERCVVVPFDVAALSPSSESTFACASTDSPPSDPWQAVNSSAPLG